MTKHFHAALNKINALNMASGASILTGENRFLTRLLQDALNLDPLSLAEIKNQSIIEYIKINFIMERYNELIQYIQHQQNEPGVNQFILCEAKLIALMNAGRSNEAKHYLEQIKSLFLGKNSHILKLRACEIDLSNNRALLNDLYFFSSELLCAPKPNPSDIVFVLHVVKLLGKSEFNQVKDLAHAVLSIVQSLNDEWLLATALLALYPLAAAQEREKLEYDFIKLYFHTQYRIVRKLLLQAYPDLKHVEKQDCLPQAKSLFEELLTICHFY